MTSSDFLRYLSELLEYRGSMPDDLESGRFVRLDVAISQVNANGSNELPLTTIENWLVSQSTRRYLTVSDFSRFSLLEHRDGGNRVITHLVLW